MGSRFDTIPVPRWAYDEDSATLLDSLETSMPLARASDLSRPSLAEIIHELSEGLIGEVVDIVSNAAINAIRTGEEHISEATITTLGYTPLSKLRNAPLRREMM